MFETIRSEETSQINGDDLSSVRHKASRHFSYKNREYLEDRINELAADIKKKNVRGLYRRITHSWS
jgi:hypothetical protein